LGWAALKLNNHLRGGDELVEGRAEASR
jgi:hypothetical protein